MQTVAPGMIPMVKPNPFQHELFDFKYIEDQVAKIKGETKEIEHEEEDKEVEEDSLKEILHEQLSVLKDIHSLLLTIDKNTQKKRWFNTKD